MYHYRQSTTADWEAWAQVPDAETGELRAASEQDLLNRGTVVVHQDAAHVVYACGRLRGPYDDLPGEAITPTEGPHAYLAQRHRALPAEVRPQVLRARVYRAPPGHSLAGSMAEAIRVHRGARAARGVPSRIEPLHIPESRVMPGDAVEASGLVPVRWAGEPAS